MENSKIQLAIQALEYLLHKIGEESYFNVLKVGTNVDPFSIASVKKSPNILESVLSSFARPIPNCGEVDINKLFEYISGLPFIESYNRIVFFLTSGKIQVSLGEFAQIIRKKLFKTKLFAIGIGQESLVLKRAILESQSRFEVLHTVEDIPNKLDFLIRNSALPSFTDFRLKIENAALFSYIIPLSKSFGYVVTEELVEFFIIFNKKLEVVK